ncbi:oxygenase MpaB family protein [Ferrimicrobium sp.]|uniref:oxygenase MpaB family protein n=1 Tax=Ferrimicrobium sp. TaxID=2926050 RepID=UPI00261170AC|nr:oxygenase MpaB family protein [Ferrimicrobium sp.]
MDTLFGPDSAVWQLHSDFSGLVGGLRALAVQSLEPRALAGVRQFSRFGDRPDQRLRETIDFIDTITYGDMDEVRSAIAAVRRLHEPVEGVVPDSGAAFSANDPFLLAWVHNAMVESICFAYERFHPEVDHALYDRYVAEMTRFAELMGCEMTEVPLRYGDLSQWVWRQPNLVVNEATMEAFTILERLRPAGFVGQVYPFVMRWLYASLPNWVTLQLDRSVSTMEESLIWVGLKIGGELSMGITAPSPRRLRAQSQYAQEDADATR